MLEEWLAAPASRPGLLTVVVLLALSFLLESPGLEPSRGGYWLLALGGVVAGAVFALYHYYLHELPQPEYKIYVVTLGPAVGLLLSLWAGLVLKRWR